MLKSVDITHFLTHRATHKWQEILKKQPVFPVCRLNHLDFHRWSWGRRLCAVKCDESSARAHANRSLHTHLFQTLSPRSLRPFDKLANYNKEMKKPWSSRSWQGCSSRGSSFSLLSETVALAHAEEKLAALFARVESQSVRVCDLSCSVAVRFGLCQLGTPRFCDVKMWLGKHQNRWRINEKNDVLPSQLNGANSQQIWMVP